MFMLQFIKVAKLHILSSNETNFIVGYHHTRNCIKDHSIRKVENYGVLLALQAPATHSLTELSSSHTKPAVL